MNEKINLLESAAKKASTNKAYMSYYIEQYSAFEDKTSEEVRSLLNCSQEDYYLLCLCKAPTLGQPDFIDELNKIGEFTHISALMLNNIIKQVSALEKFSSSNLIVPLMAARDKEPDEENLKDKKENDKD